MAFILMQMGLNMKVSGRMIYNMAKESKHGLMDQFIQECIWKGKNKEMENMNGQMVRIMMETGMIIK